MIPINFWLMNGNPPITDRVAEIVIRSFQYLPDVNPEIDFADFALFARFWLESDYSRCNGIDLTGDGDVNFGDLEKLAGNWLKASWK